MPHLFSAPDRGDEIDEVLQLTSRLLSNMSDQVGVVFMPTLLQFAIRSMDFVLVGESKWARTEDAGRVCRVLAAKARALAAYIAFANKLDAARLRAARQGAAAYQREIDAEQKSAASDPSIAARDAAGFSQSCNAR